MASRIVTTLPYTEKDVAIGNFDKTRTTIDRVIIHTMVGTEESASARFANPTQQVSAHYGVRLDGKIIHWLEETFTAYHAGDYSVNQRSIGIEHEDNGDYNGTRTDALYETSSKLVRDICQFYSIPIDRTHILKHSEVHPTGCPDALDIERIVRVAQSGTVPQPPAPMPDPPPQPAPPPVPTPPDYPDLRPLISTIRNIAFGPGYWWVRLNKIKELVK